MDGKKKKKQPKNIFSGGNNLPYKITTSLKTKQATANQKKVGLNRELTWLVSDRA